VAVPYDITVVVPVLNEQESLPHFDEELRTAISSWHWDDRSATVEILYVDDGSTDDSPNLLATYAKNEDTFVVTLRRNFGKSAALQAGFDHAGGQVVVTLDADGQDDPNQVPRLLERLESGKDLVGGWRARRQDRFAKRFASKAYNRVTRRLTGLDLHDLNTGMKAMRSEVCRDVTLYGDLHRFIPVLAHKLGYVVDEVDVEHRARIAGETKYRSPLRFARTVLDLMTVLMLTNFGDRPLYLLGGLGAISTGIGGVILVYLAALKIFTGAGIGQRPLLFLGMLLVLAGVQFIGVGFLGDVLRHSRSREQSPYRTRQPR
jgi:glycosyltransferase involved in cell wall biosynthesis